MKRPLVAALGLLALAPITAEFLYGYLDVTGDLVASFWSWLFFVPLYGAAALLVRELSVRRGLGWPTRLAWGAAFGLAMTTLVDLSLFMPDRWDISYWSQIMEPTRIEALGFSIYPLLIWVLGHMVLSIAAPIVIVETLAGPRLAARPWLARPWLVLAAIALLGVATVLRIDESRLWATHPSLWQTLGSATGVVAIVVLGLWLGNHAPIGRALRPWPPQVITITFLVGFVAANSVPTWPGVALTIALTAAALVLLARWSAHHTWSAAHRAATVLGPILGTVLVSFWTPPAAGVSTLGVTLQATLFTVATLALIALVMRRARAHDEPPTAPDEPPPVQSPPAPPPSLG